MVNLAQMKDKTNLKEKVTEAVCHLYSSVSDHPDIDFHFPTGEKAALMVGYPKSSLQGLPSIAVESFAGVGYHFQTGAVKEGDRVLDIGSGSGTDLLIAATTVGEKGHVAGIDITKPMLEKARKAVKMCGFKNVELIEAPADKLPCEDGTEDVVISNGVINLVMDKEKCFAEIYRVLKPGGTLSFADIVLSKDISEEARQDPKLWAECIVGAAVKDNFLQLIKDAGFEDVEVVDELDYFKNSSSKHTQEVAGHYKATSIVVQAKKPAKK